jgi:hypothetical protein
MFHFCKDFLEYESNERYYTQLIQFTSWIGAEWVQQTSQLGFFASLHKHARLQSVNFLSTLTSIMQCSYFQSDAKVKLSWPEFLNEDAIGSLQDIYRLSDSLTIG